MLTDPRIARLLALITAALHPPAGLGRIVLAPGFGALCHRVIAAGVLAMIVVMFRGRGAGLGRVPLPWAVPANAG